jgi:hypothetical protein
MIELNLVAVLIVLAVIAGTALAFLMLATLVNVGFRIWISNFRAGKSAVMYVKNKRQFEAWLAYEERRKASEGGQEE